MMKLTIALIFAFLSTTAVYAKWIRLSIDDIASVGTVVTNNPRKYAGLA